MADVTFKVSGDNLVIDTVGMGKLVQTGPSTWSYQGDSLPALPSGAYSIHRFDQYSATGGAHIPNLVAGGPDLVLAAATPGTGTLTGNGTITFGAAKDMSTFTVSCMVEVTAINNLNMILYDLANYANFSIHSVSSLGGPGVPVNPRNNNNFPVGNSPNLNTQYGGFTNLPNFGKRVITAVFSGTRLSMWVDDIEAYVADGVSAPAVSITTFKFGISPEPIQSAHIYSGALIAWGRGLVAEEVRDTVTIQRAMAAAAGVTVPPLLSRFLIINGTSLDGHFDSNQWPWQFAAHDSPENIAACYAINGSTLGGITSRAALIKSLLPPAPARSGRTFIYVCGGLTNDMPAYTPSTVVNALAPTLAAHMLDMKDAGYNKLGLATVGSRGDAVPGGMSNFDATRAVWNAYLLANPAVFGLDSAAQIADIASVPGIGSSFDATKFNGDKLHHNAAGGALAYPPWAGVINAL